MNNIPSRQPRPSTVKHRLQLKYNTSQKILMVVSCIAGTVCFTGFLALLFLPLPDSLLKAVMTYLALVLGCLNIFNYHYAKWNDDEV